MYFVYILLCGDGKFYTGFTHNIKKRIVEHRKGLVQSIKCRLPIKVFWVGIFRNERVAVSFEKYLKSSSGKSFFQKRFI